MHLIITYAASHALPASEAFKGLQLRNLQALLPQLQRQQTLHDPEPTPLQMPHERLQAQALGWPLEAPTLPWAAWQQSEQGRPSAEPQAWMTPCHWQVGMDHVVMADPAHLHLSDEESQQLLQARRLVERRQLLGSSVGRRLPRSKTEVTASSLVRTYQREVARQRQLVNKADAAQSRLIFFVGAMRRLLGDEHFSTLLRAERLETMPKFLAERVSASTGG